MPPSHTNSRSTFALIGDQYLDTELSTGDLKKINDELVAREILGVKRLFYEYVAASSLWWNIVWWEWAILDERDVLFGWGLNVVFGALGALGGWFLWPWAGAVCLPVTMHLCTLYIGFGIRNNSK